MSMQAAQTDCATHQRGKHPDAIYYCGRCGHATGSSYGHMTGVCDRDPSIRRSHMCCVVSCELAAGPSVNTSAPCHV